MKCLKYFINTRLAWLQRFGGVVVNNYQFIYTFRITKLFREEHNSNLVRISSRPLDCIEKSSVIPYWKKYWLCTQLLQGFVVVLVFCRKYDFRESTGLSKIWRIFKYIWARQWIFHWLWWTLVSVDQSITKSYVTFKNTCTLLVIWLNFIVIST